MKKIVTLLALFITMAAGAQKTEVRIGAVSSLFKSSVGDAFGGELYVGQRWGAFSGGLNMQVTHSSRNGIYAPITASIGLSAGPVTFHVDPGFLIHNQSAGLHEERGRYYFGSGIRFTGEDNLYVNLQYGKNYTHIDDGSKTTGVGSLTISVGYQFGGRD
jgi:opacity protein-like surface antigen